MKRILFPLAAWAAFFFTAGCSHIDLQPQGDTDRVLSGSVDFPAPDPLPADLVVSVRLVDMSGLAGVPIVLGEQTIENAGAPPVAFKFDYHAEDEQLRRGLNLEARVSIGGKLRFYNINGFGVTLAKADQPQNVRVNPTGGN